MKNVQMKIEQLGLNKWFLDRIDSTKLIDHQIARVITVNNLLSAHKECHFFRVYFDCGADFQYSSSSIFNRLNINF